MHAEILKGSREEIADAILRVAGDIREVIVVFEEPTAPERRNAIPTVLVEDMFAEMEPYMSDATYVDDSREAIYSRMEGE